ncbi:hypothetical protein E18064_130026 [Elizabethkingia anophelis]|nr:hypothetical protein E18064_130026 [Elizabethkingia anophelis]
MGNYKNRLAQEALMVELNDLGMHHQNHYRQVFSTLFFQVFS